METAKAKKDVAYINLMGAKPTAADTPKRDAQVYASLGAIGQGMTLDGLKENYESILRTRALFYPVAYQFQDEIGRGRQGVVFLGLRQGARGCFTQFAIKLFDPGIYRSVEEYWTDMGRISYQVSKLQRLQSPNLVSSHSYEEMHGIGYIQMEVIDGLDLRRMLSNEHLEVARKRSTKTEWSHFTRTIFRLEGGRVSLQPGIAVYILRGALRGLERVHTLGFLHSDIKPGNIMVDRLGNVKLIDFGRAVVLGEKLTFLFGSPMYMAPETHRREVGGAPSDCYSLGLVALEMLRGRLLSDKPDITEEELLKIKMDLPSNLNSTLPRHVVENQSMMSILQKLAHPDPARRFASARDAEVGEEGLRIIDKQLVRAGLDSEYARDLSDYLSKLVNPDTQRIDVPSRPA